LLREAEFSPHCDVPKVGPQSENPVYDPLSDVFPKRVDVHLRNPDVERSDAISDKKNAFAYPPQEGKLVGPTENIDRFLGFE
jgi:hypothetical protein